MKGNLQTISLSALVGALMMPALTVDGKAANVVGQEIAKGGAGSTYYQVPSDHAAMRRAVHEARRTVKKFIVALRHPAPGQTDFEVKKPFIQGNGILERQKMLQTGQVLFRRLSVDFALVLPFKDSQRGG